MIDQIMKFGLEYFGLYYGKYKAQVVSNSDPSNNGRLQLYIPQVHGPLTAPIWAWAHSVAAGKDFGLWWIPDVGDWVYVTFDHGRPEFPIWESGWWANGDATSDMVPSKVVLATKEGMKVVIDRTAHTMLLQQSEGNSILLARGKINIESALIEASESGGVAQALVNQTFLTWFTSSAYPWMVSKGYIGTPVPDGSATTTLTAE